MVMVMRMMRKLLIVVLMLLDILELLFFMLEFFWILFLFGLCRGYFEHLVYFGL